MKRRFPLILVLVFGIIGVITYFIPHPIVQNSDELFRNNTLRIIGSFGLVLGLSSFIRHHTLRIQRHKENSNYSWIALVALAFSGIVGLLGGGMDPSVRGLIPTHIGSFSFHVTTLFNYIAIPISATMFAILAFYMASASYRAFRARNLQATLLLVAAFIVMLGSVPLSRKLLDSLPYYAQYLLDIPNTASKRGIGFGVGLGSIATSLKIILGIERGWLGGEQ
jgi:MFS family permease